jgi:hypothetical protein
MLQVHKVIEEDVAAFMTLLNNGQLTELETFATAVEDLSFKVHQKLRLVNHIKRLKELKS